MSEKVAKKLGVAQELIEHEKLDEGLSELQSILEFKKLSPYERGQVNYFLAYLQYLKEDYKGAIVYYQRVVDDEMYLMDWSLLQDLLLLNSIFN